jgi:hypothetical protein
MMENGWMDACMHGGSLRACVRWRTGDLEMQRCAAICQPAAVGHERWHVLPALRFCLSLEP